MMADEAIAARLIGELAPRRISRPETPEALAAALAEARQAGEAVVPWGAGTKQSLGNAPRRYDVALDVSALDQILEYEPADLVVTVQAGVPLRALQERLATNGQFLALDPPCAAAATIGGTLAANASGPSRLLYGTARDLVLGMRWANPAGELVKSGGKVVKNVVGYDLHKMHLGALGTLGVIAEVTFKVHPLPAAEASVMATLPSLAAAAEVARQLAGSQLNLRAVELVRAPLPPLDGSAGSGGAAGSEDAWRVLCWAAGSPATTDRQARDAATALREAGATATERLEGAAHAALWQAVRELGRDTGSGDAGTLLKLTCLPTRLAALIEAITAAARATGAGQESPPPEVVAHAGNGIVYAAFASADTTLVEAVRRAAAPFGGSVVVESAPDRWKAQVDAWGPPRDDLPLMQALKAQFDPQGTLSPGRFVGGI